MSNQKDFQKIISLDAEFNDPFRQKLFGFLQGTLEKVFSLDELNRIYNDVKQNQDDRSFVEQLVERLNIRFEINEEDLERIPRSGPVVVTANHPFGGIEGVLLASILKSVRPDVKIMANYLLQRIPDMQDLFFFVDPFEGKDSYRKNMKSIKESLEWVQNGGMLAMFPAGEVAHLNLQSGRVTDPEWHDTAARIVRKTGASALPVYFNGFNGALFQLVGLIHSRLRTAMLPKEFVNKQDTHIQIRIGRPIEHSKLKGFETDTEMTTYLRQRTYMLQNLAKEEDTEKASFSMSLEQEHQETIIDPVPEATLRKEIDALPEKQLLVENKEYRVYYAWQEQAPELVREIGRLREYTFRDTNEGTGTSLDLDDYDTYYIHLFVWNNETGEVIGAYRLGQTDTILERYGQKGLYTTTLFNIKNALFRQISPALEMGRSFVRTEYQKSYAPLLLLWRGIGEFVVNHPKYKHLFGPVSISKEYNSFSRHLMVTFLRIHNFLPDMARNVKPKKPFRARGIKGLDPKNKAVISNIDDVSELISEFERDNKGVPILLKQYLKLGGKLLGFNVDPDFSDVLDGLILVDLTQTDTKILERYMGREGVQTFLEYHGVGNKEVLS